MGKCEIKTGVFILKECGDFASVKCSNCGKFTCAKHAKQMGDKIVCVECDSKQQRNDTKNKKTNQRSKKLEIGNRESYMYWYFWQRNQFYIDNEFDGFDVDDFDSFDADMADEYYDETDSGGLFDS